MKESIMPELPEVETTRRGIQTQTEQAVIDHILIRQPKLRWDVPLTLREILPSLKIQSVKRRAKYLLLATKKGTLIIHLGMSGNLRILPTDTPPKKHDHIDLVFTNGFLLRYHDPRRLGAWLWTQAPIEEHPLLCNLAPEPLSDEFNADWISPKIHDRKSKIKTLIMNNTVVVGVGNIYANEVLFMTKIHPERAGNSVTKAECEQLVQNIKTILTLAIEQGGTTLKDFLTPDGSPGYFVQKLSVYNQENAPCPTCGTPIQKKLFNQRSAYFCPQCQELNPTN